MQKDLIVAIFTPITSSETRGGRTTSGIFGTGYPVAEDLILTSRHVVAPANRKANSPIRVRWCYDQPADGKSASWLTLKKEDVVWVGAGDLDAALIRCPRPESLRHFSLDHPLERRPRNKECWESAGFPRASKRDDVREPDDFGGSVRTMAKAAAYFEVIEDANPDCVELWKGVSGMPVCVESGVLGVVKQVPPNYRGRKLDVVPCWRLLEDDGFREKLGIDYQRERLERARQLLRGLLQASDDMTRDLAAAMGLTCGAIADCRDQVVSMLLEHTPPLERLFSLALEVQEKRRRARDRAGMRAAAALMLTILPAIHNAAVVANVRRDKCHAAIPMIALPTKLRTLAEIIMAGADLRAAKLRPPATRLVFPEGEASLPEPPESGRDADGEQFKRDWRADLIASFATTIERFDVDFRAYLKERFIPSDLRSPSARISERELVDTVREQLRQEANAKNATTYYFIVHIPEDPRARREREAVLKSLKAEFEHIAFLRLAGTEPLNAEYNRYGRLRDLLFEEPELDP